MKNIFEIIFDKWADVRANIQRRRKVIFSCLLLSAHVMKYVVTEQDAVFEGYATIYEDRVERYPDKCNGKSF